MSKTIQDAKEIKSRWVTCEFNYMQECAHWSHETDCKCDCHTTIDKQAEEREEENIPCANNNCVELTGFVPSDFSKDHDLDDVYCSEQCRYNAETGHPGEEY